MEEKELQKCRSNYGFGFDIKSSKPELGDIIYFEKSPKFKYIVIAIKDYRIVTLCIGQKNTNIVHFSPLSCEDGYIDMHIVGNLVGAIENDKNRFKEFCTKKKKYNMEFLTKNVKKQWRK